MVFTEHTTSLLEGKENAMPKTMFPLSPASKRSPSNSVLRLKKNKEMGRRSTNQRRSSANRRVSFSEMVSERVFPTATQGGAAPLVALNNATNTANTHTYEAPVEKKVKFEDHTIEMKKEAASPMPSNKLWVLDTSELNLDISLDDEEHTDTHPFNIMNDSNVLNTPNLRKLLQENETIVLQHKNLQNVLDANGVRFKVAEVPEEPQFEAKPLPQLALADVLIKRADYEVLDYGCTNLVKISKSMGELTDAEEIPWTNTEDQSPEIQSKLKNLKRQCKDEALLTWYAWKAKLTNYKISQLEQGQNMLLQDIKELQNAETDFKFLRESLESDKEKIYKDEVTVTLTKTFMNSVPQVASTPMPPHVNNNNNTNNINNNKNELPVHSEEAQLFELLVGVQHFEVVSHNPTDLILSFFGKYTTHIFFAETTQGLEARMNFGCSALVEVDPFVVGLVESLHLYEIATAVRAVKQVQPALLKISAGLARVFALAQEVSDLRKLGLLPFSQRRTNAAGGTVAVDFVNFSQGSKFSVVFHLAPSLAAMRPYDISFDVTVVFGQLDKLSIEQTISSVSSKFAKLTRICKKLQSLHQQN